VELDLDLDPFSSVLVAEPELERFRTMDTGGVVVRKKSCMVTSSCGSCVRS
jgi:hypothetical protein